MRLTVYQVLITSITDDSEVNFPIAKAKMAENKEQRIESLLEFPHNYSSVALDPPLPRYGQ